MSADKLLKTPHGVFRIVPFDGKHIDAFSTLWNAAFGRPLDPHIRRWKFENNPFGMLMTLCYAENGDLVACFGGIPYSALYHGHLIRILHAVDNMSHPKYRGVLSGRKGLFVQVVEHFLAHQAPSSQICFIYGYPGERHYRLGHLMLGYKPLPGSLHAMSANHHKMKMKYYPLWRIVEEIPDAEDLETLSRCASHSLAFSVLRNAVFFQWRFLQHPCGAYRVWTCRRAWQRQLRGYAVWRAMDGEAILVDLFWDGSEAALKALIGRSCADLVSKGITSLQAWVPQRAYLPEMFHALGFRQAQEALHIVPAYVQRPLSPVLFPEEAAQSFYGTMADADLY